MGSSAQTAVMKGFFSEQKGSKTKTKKGMWLVPHIVIILAFSSVCGVRLQLGSDDTKFPPLWQDSGAFCGWSCCPHVASPCKLPWPFLARWGGKAAPPKHSQLLPHPLSSQYSIYSTGNMSVLDPGCLQSWAVSSEEKGAVVRAETTSKIKRQISLPKHNFKLTWVITQECKTHQEITAFILNKWFIRLTARNTVNAKKGIKTVL